MNGENLLWDAGSVGVILIFALLVIQKILDSKRKGVNGHGRTRAEQQIAEMHKVMARTDSGGVPLVYQERSVAKAMGQMASSIDEQTSLLRTIAEKASEEHRRIETELAGLKREVQTSNRGSD